MLRFVPWLGTGLILATAISFSTQPAAVCEMNLQLVDAESGDPLAGLVRITNEDGEVLHPPQLQSRGIGLPQEQVIQEWSVVPSRGARFSVPAGKLTLTVISGLEYKQLKIVRNLTRIERTFAELKLQKFSHLRSKSVVSGNTHLHLMKLTRAESDRYLQEIPRADGLDVLFVSYLERADADHDYISNQYRQRDLAALSRENLPLGNGEEHRHNFGPGDEGYGHVMFLDLPELVLPVSLGPGITKRGSDGIPIQRGIDLARKSRATVVWCHNSWGRENIPSWVTGRLDAQNIFDGGEHGSYEDSFYRYLNAGIKVPFSTGTDWFIYDFSRAYVQLERDEKVTPQSWLAALRAGRSFITNGPLLEFTVAEKSPGAQIDLQQPDTLTLKARVLGRHDFRQLEIVVNGRVVRTSPAVPMDGYYLAELTIPVEISEPSWLALRTPPPPLQKQPDRFASVAKNEFGQSLFSHSSPVYVSLKGDGVFQAPVAKGLLAEMEHHRREIAQRGQFADDEERSRVLAVHDEAIEQLQTRLQKGER